jgi:hypothetical protein
MARKTCGMCSYFCLKMPDNREKAPTSGWCHKLPPEGRRQRPLTCIDDLACGAFVEKVREVVKS